MASRRAKTGRIRTTSSWPGGYEMVAPNIGGFVSVHDEGEMELQLVFKRD